MLYMFPRWLRIVRPIIIIHFIIHLVTITYFIIIVHFLIEVIGSKAYSKK